MLRTGEKTNNEKTNWGTEQQTTTGFLLTLGKEVRVNII